MTDATGVTTKTYDAASRVTAVAAPGGTVSYGYNNAGQRSGMTLPGGRTVSYGYDTGGRLASLTDWAARTTSFAYNTNDWRTAINHPNAVTSAFAYDAAGQVTSISHNGPGDSLLALSHAYDANGNRTSTTKNGSAETFTLDALNRLTSVTYPGGATTSYTYDANGNRLTKTVGGATTNYTYDNAGQLTTDGVKTYTYDGNGNQTGAGTDTFAYDYANRMTSATVGGTATTYGYDGDAVRTTKTAGGSTTSYLWDRETGLPLLVDDGTNAYLHADGALAEVPVGGTPRYILDDALGSVRGVTDSTGVLTATADYDVFGAIRASTGTQSLFAFTGEQRDPETGFTFLRARYLDPTTGRFTQADTIQPNAPGTQGWNLYSYVANNPTTWVDPSGRISGDAVAAGVAIVTVQALIKYCYAFSAALLLAQQYVAAGLIWVACTVVLWYALPPIFKCVAAGYECIRDAMIVAVALCSVPGICGGTNPPVWPPRPKLGPIGSTLSASRNTIPPEPSVSRPFRPMPSSP